MNTIKSNVVQIAHTDKQSDLSSGKQLFNKLIKRINAHRKELSAWQEIIPAYQQKYSSEFLPLVAKLDGFKEELVYLLDNSYKNTNFSRKERMKLADFICSLSEDLLAEQENEKLKQIYNKYSRSDFDLEKEEMQGCAKSMLEDMLGIDLENDIDINSPEALFEEVAQKMEQKLEQEEGQRSMYKKSAKVKAKEAAQKQEEQEISQSIKAIYRELVVSLHPDKEQDDKERQRKTALMQKINVAYKNKDLLTLLELQLEVEQINQSTINAMTEKRVAHYNAVLTNQVRELKLEILGIKHMFQIRFPSLAKKLLSPKHVMENLYTDIRMINRDIKQAAQELLLFKNVKHIKAFLRNYMPQTQEDFIISEMDELFYSLSKGNMRRTNSR